MKLYYAQPKISLVSTAVIETRAVILAGGKGTRSADPSIPKLNQVIDGNTLLHYHLSLLEKSSISSALVIAGHLGEKVRDLVDSIETPVALSFFQESESLGTVSAIQYAASETQEDRFLVILGDILCSFDVDLFINEWESSGKSVAVITHPSTHPHDSDVVFQVDSSNVLVRAKNEDKSGIPNMSSAGIFAITREAIENYSDCSDIGSDVLPRAAQNNDLFCWTDSHYFKDTGTPQRLNQAREDVNNGVFQRRGNLALRPAIFLDRDGVINPTVPEIYSFEEFNLSVDVSLHIAEVNKLGVPIFVVTNQPGIAKGFMTEQDHVEIRAELDRQLSIDSAFIDEYYFCPHHPESGFAGEVKSLKKVCLCRKPETLLVENLSAKHGIDIPHSIMIGDTWRDHQLAVNLGMNFFHVYESNCEIPTSHSCFDSSAKAIERAKLEVSK